MKISLEVDDETVAHFVKTVLESILEWKRVTSATSELKKE